MRLLIASLLKPDSDQLLRQAYANTFGHKCRIKTLHLTFIPPFTTSDPSIIQNYLTTPLHPTSFTTGSPGIFSRHRQILYLPLHPTPPLESYYRSLFPLLRPLITFESSDFPPDTIPAFLPHITLDYDFTYPLHWSLPALSVDLTQPQLLLEHQPGIWKPYV